MLQFRGKKIRGRVYEIQYRIKGVSDKDNGRNKGKKIINVIIQEHFLKPKSMISVLKGPQCA